MTSKSIFEQNIQRGVKDGVLSFNEDRSRVTYHCSRDFSTSFKNPEEKVRASYSTQLVLNYDYPKERINFEVVVPRRKPEDKADIVIYEDNELKRPYIVVECKKDGITGEEYKQAIEQVFGNANSLRSKLASVVAGTTKTAFDVAGFKPSEREKNVIADIPVKYGRTPKYRFVKGEKDKELKVVSKDELITALGKSHDTVWQGGKLAPTTAFDEVSKLLFCKLRDEKLTKRGEPYKFQVGTHETPEEVYKRIDSIYQKAKQEDSEVFKEDIGLDPKVVYSVVEHLQELAINKIDLDTKGIAFERFMEDFFKGKMGQFFTPREIIRFCVQMLSPQRGDLVLDPACGSGGFLLNAMDKVRDYAEKNYDDREAWEYWHSFAMNNLYGIEINDQIARVCKMNMIIHNDGHTNIISTDSLRDIDEITDIHKSFKKAKFDIILTNPPFGANVKSTEKNYLDHYELGKGKKNQKTEILFIERCVNFVKPKTGRIAIVLPDGILTNSSSQYVRDYIMARCQILAIVSLPQFAFTHFGAGVKSSLVFLRRKGENEKLGNYPIFMAIADHIGYDATGRKDPKSDLHDIQKSFHTFISKGSVELNAQWKLIKYNDLEQALNAERYLHSLQIPKAAPLGEAVDIIHKVVTPSRSKPTELFDWIRIDEVSNGGLLRVENIRTLEGSKISGTVQYADAGDILLARLGPSLANRKILFCPKTPNTTVVSNEFIVLKIKEGWSPEYIYSILRSNFYIKYLLSKGRGATPSRLRVNREDLPNLSITKLEYLQQKQVGEAYMASYQKAFGLRKKTKELIDSADKAIDDLFTQK